MDLSGKTQEQLIAEINALRERIAEMERQAGDPAAADAAHRDREERYHQLFEAERDGIVLAAAETGRIIDLNRSFLAMTGQTRSGLMDRIVWEIRPFGLTDAVEVMAKELRMQNYLYYDDLPLQTGRASPLSVEIIGTKHAIGGRQILQFVVRDISRRKDIERELWKAESRFRALFQKAAFGIAIVDAEGRIVETNQQLQRMLDYTEKEFVGKHVTDFTHDEDQQSDTALFQELLAHQRDHYQMAIRCLKKDGTMVWGLLAESLIRDTTNEPLYAIRMIEDISDRKRAEEVVIKSRNFYLSLIDELPNPIRRTDADGQSDYFNRAWLEFTGRTISQEIGDAWNDGVHPDDLSRLVQIEKNSFRNRTPYVTEYRLRNSRGEYRWMVEYGRPIKDIDDSFSGYISSCYDVQDRKTFEETLHSLSTTDELTGLLNRRGFFSLAQQQLKVANRNKTGLLLLYVDLDGLKKINDNLGHPEGDHAILETAAILREIFRESDIIGRLGGDEFAVLALEHSRGGDDEQAILARMNESIKTRNAQPGRRFSLSLSAGINIYDPEKPCSLDQLISKADTIMYEEKKAKYRVNHAGS